MPPTATIILPVEVWAHICNFLARRSGTSSLLPLMRVSPQLYDITSPLIYRKASINESNISSFLLGLDKDMTDGIVFNPVSAEQEAPLGIGSGQSLAARQDRKLQALAHVEHLVIDEIPSNGNKKAKISAQERGRQLARHVPILEWALKRAVASDACARLLPSLRHIEYYENYRIRTYNYIDGRSRSPHRKLPLVIKMQPALLPTPRAPLKAVKRGSSVPDGGPRWDIELHIEPSGTQIQSPIEGAAAIRDWMMQLSGQGALHNLDLYTEDSKQYDLHSLQLRGTLRVHCTRRPQLPVRPPITDFELWARQPEVNAYTRMFTQLLQVPLSPGAYDGGARIEIYNAFGLAPGWPDDTVDLIRKAVFANLRAKIGARVKKDAGAEGAYEVMAKGRGLRRSLWLAPTE